MINGELEIKTRFIGRDPELGQAGETSGIDAEVADDRQVGACNEIGVIDADRDRFDIAVGKCDRNDGADGIDSGHLIDIGDGQRVISTEGSAASQCRIDDTDREGV